MMSTSNQLVEYNDEIVMLCEQIHACLASTIIAFCDINHAVLNYICFLNGDISLTNQLQFNINNYLKSKSSNNHWLSENIQQRSNEYMSFFR